MWFSIRWQAFYIDFQQTTQENKLGQVIYTNFNHRLRFHSINGDQLPEFSILLWTQSSLIAPKTLSVQSDKAYFGEHDDEDSKLEYAQNTYLWIFLCKNLMLYPIFVKAWIESRQKKVN